MRNVLSSRGRSSRSFSASSVSAASSPWPGASRGCHALIILAPQTYPGDETLTIIQVPKLRAGEKFREEKSRVGESA
ncbi:hypothetical protein DBV15_01159 [Temnothorax longispinosus]|uniref:Uncharacterized protein n=1 Tax=Temnothorax longispinosus TaxID=300112 RepID=A0A4S2J9B1_9HYME|nr:hypothetical protein DBV15_01159 [Temnothorax longispinosus]